LVARIVMSRKQDTASRRGADEIVEEIVDHLRPWKSHKSIAAITAAVNHELNVLLQLAPLQAKGELRGRRQPPGLRKKSCRAVSYSPARADSDRPAPPGTAPGAPRPRCRPAPSAGPAGASYGVAGNRRAFVKRAADPAVPARAANPARESAPEEDGQKRWCSAATCSCTRRTGLTDIRAGANIGTERSCARLPTVTDSLRR
jgi:hypothetical protein